MRPTPALLHLRRHADGLLAVAGRIEPVRFVIDPASGHPVLAVPPDVLDADAPTLHVPDDDDLAGAGAAALAPRDRDDDDDDGSMEWKPPPPPPPPLVGGEEAVGEGAAEEGEAAAEEDRFFLLEDRVNLPIIFVPY